MTTECVRVTWRFPGGGIGKGIMGVWNDMKRVVKNSVAFGLPGS